MTLPTTKFAVYHYIEPANPTDHMAVGIYATSKEAEMGMFAHAETELKNNPQWNNNKTEKFPPNGIEVYTEDGKLQIKFEVIEVIEDVHGNITKAGKRAASIETDGSSPVAGEDLPMRDLSAPPVAVEEAEAFPSSSSKAQANPALVRRPVVNDTSNNGSKHYGLYICPDPCQPKISYLISSSDSPGEIESYAKVTATALLKQLNKNNMRLAATCTIHDKGIYILKGKRVVIRYKIVEGRTVNGMFVNEADWAAGRRKPELVAWAADAPDRMPRMVKLTAVNAGANTIADKTKSTPKPKAVLKATPKAKRKTPKRAGGAVTKSKTPARKNKAKVLAAPAQPTLAPGKVNPPNVYCVCRMPDDGRELMACETGDDDCPYNGWFHLACENMTEVPEGEWWCPLCRQSQYTNVGEEDRPMGGV
ncbi:hypothetical protein K458DRAFT_384017 [Lentithecium fluviatile CBS 122367]|uniref:PHD-type domain-containing protein n=1 Tax=Lentithecium fluviatile CBS 122367 TaxID=1168545 RepID=A0A6G1JGR5_9PLEO|nr:hypothetical protein K458DRAFT_384017 [Lentithecium fluviatile CBS 122367]